MENIEVTELGPVFEKFWSSSTTINDGRSVRVRKPPSKRLRASDIWTGESKTERRLGQVNSKQLLKPVQCRVATKKL